MDALSNVRIYIHRLSGNEIKAAYTERTGNEGYDVIGPGGSSTWWSKELFERTYKPKE